MKEDGRIFKSCLYDGFKFYPENRPISPKKVAKLVIAMQEKNMLRENPLTARREQGAFWILGGQHRFLAAKELNVPFWYIITKTQTIADMAKESEQVNKWNMSDYVHYYATRGNENYQELGKFIEHYGFSPGDSALMLNNRYKGSRASRSFKRGGFEIGNYKMAVRTAQHLIDYKKYFDGWNKRYFLRAITFLTHHAEYDHKLMMKKMAHRHALLLFQLDVPAYLKNLEEIYNHRQRKKVKFEYE